MKYLGKYHNPLVVRLGRTRFGLVKRPSKLPGDEVVLQ